MNPLRRLLIKPLLTFQCYLECIMDGWRFTQAAKLLNEPFCGNLEHLESDIIRRYHAIEKGLAMPEFRARFGTDTIQELIHFLQLWDSFNGDEESAQIEAARIVVDAYFEKHRELGLDVADLGMGSSDASASSVNVNSGVIAVSGAVTVEDQEAFKRVVDSRHSVRDFDVGRIPDRAVIEAALEQAIRSPSVCNRQTWRLHAFEGEKAQAILEKQNGNRGFGHTIPTVLVVTSDMRYFMGNIERYQGWIDGGMFSMLLLLALHAHGLGAVSLNWSVLNKRDKALRSVSGIPSYERIVMVIGCGYPREDSFVTASPRNPTKSFIKWN